MWIGVKHLLAVVTVDGGTVGVLCKIPHIFTNSVHTDMLYIYNFCDDSATADNDSVILKNVLY
jgi:hypothetical protein